MTVETSKRINVTFPVSLLEKLRETLPRRERNHFIVEATEKELRRLKAEETLLYLREHGPIWTVEDHPELATNEDIDRYVRNMREAWMPRDWDEILVDSETDSAEAENA